MKFYDDDMDELFNKAGRDYPLKTEPKNWDAVRAALLQENGTVEVTKKRTGWKRLLPLLFLLMIPAAYLFIDKDNISNENNRVTQVNSLENKQESDKIAVTKNKIENTNSSGDREINSQPQAGEVREGEREIVAGTGTERKREGETVLKTETERERVGEEMKIEREGTGERVVGEMKTEREREGKRVVGERQLKINFQQENANDNPTTWNNTPSLNTGFYSIHNPSEEISLNTPIRSLNQSTGLTSVPNSDKKIKNKKGFYLGVIAAPDVSTIKGQEVKGIGYSAGAIIGYTISKRWQVEGGVLWSHKKYYTDGKYFDKKGPGLPDNLTVVWLNGGCEMLEFPFVARYNFSEKKNRFFASAGVTSYMMKTEDYNYKAISQPNNYAYEGYRKYDRSGDHLFANLQLSGGYNFSLSSKLNIRIEPYLKTPLKKIGIGKMPITSTGLYFAITRDLR